MFTRVILPFVALMLTCMISSCSSCSGDKEHKGDAEVAEITSKPNHSFNATLEYREGDSIIITRNDTGERDAMNITGAQMEGKVLGTLTEGSLLSILADDGDERKVQIAVNVSELEGQWFYDMQEHRGFKVEPTGAISPINNKHLCFRDWKIHNGNLIFYYVDMQQVAETKDEYHGDVATIQNLSKESMTLALHDTMLVCRRQHEPVKIRLR